MAGGRVKMVRQLVGYHQAAATSRSVPSRRCVILRNAIKQVCQDVTSSRCIKQVAPIRGVPSRMRGDIKKEHQSEGCLQGGASRDFYQSWNKIGLRS